ncbi:hypothetical protein LCGC14_0934750 [marine sediment metagenome]|uniref:Uncharacterized protein n=1 Tax=marine sediment metagenome TaxID=412755 RepID=A0A0F9RTE9_9ZZZZ
MAPETKRLFKISLITTCICFVLGSAIMVYKTLSIIYG